MFKKKPQIKTFAPLRSSDRRKLADQIIDRYSVPLPTENLESLTGLRNSLLPENTTAARFSTTAGPDLRQFSGTLYAGSFEDSTTRVLWISLEDRLLPSVYTLWRHPGLLPLLHTPGLVIQKLCTGSSLMTPGLARGPPFPVKATKGSVVAIASLDKPSVPLVVGICEIDVSHLQNVQGAKGQAVSSEYWVGDELWSWNASGSPAPDTIPGWDKISVSDETVRGLDELVISNMPVNEVSPHEPPPPSNISLTTQEIDDAFWHAFRYGVYDAIRKSPRDQHHGLTFPIDQSALISHLVLPYFAEEAVNLSMKKTSWKNTKKFIKALEKAQLLKSKDRDGGQCVIVEIYFDHATFATFRPYRLPKASSKAQVGEVSVQQIQRLALYKPKAAISALLPEDGQEYYTSGEFRAAINAYIDRENLVSNQDRRMITLNPAISEACFSASFKLDRQILDRGIAPRDALLERLLTMCCLPYGMVLHGSQTREKSRPKAGPPVKIKMTLETRSGNKTVTKVSGLEEYGISPMVVADELQKICASSMNVGPLPGCNPRQPVMEVMVQGSQKEIVWRTLEQRGVRREWVELVDKKKR